VHRIIISTSDTKICLIARLVAAVVAVVDVVVVLLFLLLLTEFLNQMILFDFFYHQIKQTFVYVPLFMLADDNIYYILKKMLFMTVGL